MDYEKLGLKCGLEIHQQLNTSKLFCSCPSMLRQDEPDFIVKRKLHAVAGESGEVDAAAKYQVSLDKNFIYQGYDSVCLVELDEEPPHEVNKESLKIALQIAIFLNAKIFPITQIMRKTVVDGSNTSGFQRTVLIARDGYLDTKYGRVGIESVCLEEDSARIIESAKAQDVYRLDRLGVPLVEIATAPDIRRPEQAREVAMHIGQILRSCDVKRGLGTIRQDVNVSIEKGARVEIKGVQKPELIEKAVEKEAERQLKVVDDGKKVSSEVRGVLPDGKTKFLRPMPGSARMYPETDLPLLKISRDFINEVKKDLPTLRTDTEKELRDKGLSEDLIRMILRENKVEDFKQLLEALDNPKLIAKILLIFPKEISRREKVPLEDVENRVPDVVELLKTKKISEDNAKHTLSELVRGKEIGEVQKKTDENLEEKIHHIIKSKPGLSENAYMGLVMKELKGQVSGKEAMEIIKKHLR